jgi:CRISPR-associated endonuclease Csn1
LEVPAVSTIKLSQKYTSVTQPYYLGLDIGTNSVGWAVTDKSYNIIKKKGKSLWGSRLFTEAQPAVTRRQFRASRRRRKRTKNRIKLLQEYFAEAINTVDPGFYQRLKDSFYLPDDKETEQKNSLFNDTAYSDQDYHSDFPTIYHLRLHLLRENDVKDPRLIYLACHHIMKNRGNFLIEGKLATDQQLDSALISIQEYWLAESGSYLWPEDKLTEIADTLLARKMTSSDKVKALQSNLINSDKETKELCKLIVGNSAKFSTVFNNDEFDESDIKSIKFADGTYENDEIQDSIQALLGDSKELVDIAFQIYGAALLQKLLQKEDGAIANSISEARVNIYETHARDLAQLKSAVKAICENDSGSNKLYNKIFRENKKGLANYVAYSGHVDTKDSSSPIDRCGQELFYKFLKNELKKYSDVESIDNILMKIEQEVFLPKITSSANGIIPHQLHGSELEKILKNAQANFDFITDEIISEITQIFNFRIPYFIGPFDDRSEFSWIKRRSNDPIRPWNINQVVNIEETAEKFIRNMTNKCTYLLGEDVLPKESLLYSEYLVLNALNTLTVDSQRLDRSIRDQLYLDLFINRTKGGRITKKRVVSALTAQGVKVTENSLGGMDLEIPAKLKSRRDFSSIVSDKLTDQEIEAIIEKITAFPDNVEMIRKYIKENYQEKLNDKQIEKIAHLTYKDWGRFSKKFLSGIKHTGADGIRRSIIETMRTDVVNLMEVLDSNRYSFSAQIKDLNEGLIEDPNIISDEYLEALRLSPAVKKAVRQSLLVCKELFGIMKGAPERIFIEMARQDGEKDKRTKSRKQHLAELYASCKQDTEAWSKEVQEMSEDKFKSKKLYLYCLQWGRCMYSGDRIPIEDLFDPSKYDIDHIYPRSSTKDDSWNNLVLVKQELNRSKKDTYPLDSNIQAKCSTLWLGLLQCGFMDSEKYKRLTRKDPLSPDELASFINRQIVETRQSTKALAEIFNRVLPESETVYVKANLVSDFRYRDGNRLDAKTEFYFPKVRNLNDFHHAKDAYLNVVVGNSYHVKFTRNFFLKQSSIDRSKYNLVKFFDREILEKGQPIWIPGENGTISTVKKMMNRNNVLLSYEAYRRSGGFFDQMLVKKGNGQHPIKSNVPALKKLNLYGGFNKVAGSHFCIFQHQKGKKQEMSIEALPIYLKSYNFSEESIINYLSQNYTNPVIICPEIKYGSIIEYNGVRYRIKAKTGNQVKCAPAIQAAYTATDEVIFKEVERAIEKDSINQSLNDVLADNLFEDITKRIISVPYCNYQTLNTLGTQMHDNLSYFEILPLESKIKILATSIKLINGNGEPVDLSIFTDDKSNSIIGSQVGAIKIVINNKKGNILRVVNRSVTGFYENVKRVF